MRTFRILSALMMAVVCVGLSSCSKDDDSEIPSSIDNTLELLIGTWEGTGEEEGSSFTFKSDGTYVEQYGKSITNGTFEYFPYRYMFVAYFHQEYGDENVIYTVVKITEDTLILNDNGHSDIMTFKCK